VTGTANGGAILWDAEQGTEIRRIEGYAGITLLAEFTPDGQYALVGSIDWSTEAGKSDLFLWNLETGDEVYRLEGYRFLVRSMAISPDGHTALVGTTKYPNYPDDPARGDLILWDLETGTMIRRFDNTDSVMDVAFSADGRRALTSSADASFDLSIPELVLWDVTTGKAIREYPAQTADGSYSVVFGPDDQTALNASGDGLLLWDLETGDILRRFVGHEDWIFTLAISPDWRYVVSGESTGIIIVWDFATGRELRRIQAHQATVSNIVFSPDGQSFFTAPVSDQSVVQWAVTDQSLEELIAWIADNRYMHELTCEEREQYDIEPLCADVGGAS
jgi:WD40 repeat protein